MFNPQLCPYTSAHTDDMKKHFFGSWTSALEMTSALRSNSTLKYSSVPWINDDIHPIRRHWGQFEVRRILKQLVVPYHLMKWLIVLLKWKIKDARIGYFNNVHTNTVWNFFFDQLTNEAPNLSQSLWEHCRHSPKALLMVINDILMH